MQARYGALFTAAGSLLLSTVFAQAWDEAEATVRWDALKTAFFKERPVGDGTALVSIDAPVRALDAASVPIALNLKGNQPVKGLYLIIDENPVPLAAHFTFGPEASPRTLTLPVRVNAYTNLHAVVETADGKLYATARFVKASGGCSAAPQGDEQKALSGIGHLKLALTDPFVAGKPQHAQLSIHHPNFNGMQMNQITRLYTPARYIRSVDVRFGDAQVLHLDSDISLSSDPVLGFAFIPPAQGKLQVQVKDTDGAVYGDTFDVPAGG